MLFEKQKKKIIKHRKWKGNPPKPCCQLPSGRFSHSIWKALLQAQLTIYWRKRTCLRDPGPLLGLRETSLPLPWDAGREALLGPHCVSPESLCPIIRPPGLRPFHPLRSPEYRSQEGSSKCGLRSRRQLPWGLYWVANFWKSEPCGRTEVPWSHSVLHRT